MKEVDGTVTHELQCSTCFDQVTRNPLANEDSLQEAALSLNLKSGCLQGSGNYRFTDYNFSYKPQGLFLKEASGHQEASKRDIGSNDHNIKRFPQ